MINTVPKGVVLTDVITPNAVKPVNISLGLASDGGLVFSGSIRVRLFALLDWAASI